MKLVAFQDISANEQIHVNLIVGLEYGHPTWIARLKTHSCVLGRRML